MLHVAVPASFRPERMWIVQVILGQFLGIEYELSFGRAEKVHIIADGRTLIVSDAFFESNMDSKCTSQNWTVASSALNARLCAPSIPVLFGAPGFVFSGTCEAELSLDVFGSAFFMLARCEEFRSTERDGHDRFPAKASLASRLDFLNRPIVDEYVEILWAAISRLWPALKRKQRTMRKLISCDVDLPFDPACVSIARLGKRIVGQACRELSLSALSASISNYWAVQRGNQARDPYWKALSWIMDVNENAGNRVTFNFIPEQTDSVWDNAPSLDDRRMRGLLRTVHARGHLVGIHPGYNTFRHPQLFARSVATLQRALDQEGVNQGGLGGRQHYLRWDAGTTAQLWEANELSYDSTLSYPTVAGFRTGSCHEYTMFDLAGRRPLALKQRPLVVMENAVMDQANMALGHGEQALAAMLHYKWVCDRFDGDFTLLWHNSSLVGEADQAMYCNLIQ